MTRRIVNNSWTFLLLAATLLFIGCSADAEKDFVPIRLSAGSSTLSADSRGAGVISPHSAFNPTFIASLVQHDFTSPQWSENASTGTDGKVTFSAGTQHYYPAFGDWIYITGVHPQAVPSNGKVTYILDGTTDVMYAATLRGNKWDSERFAGNSVNSYDQTFNFTHLLTQLQVKAKKAEADGLPITIYKITVRNVTNSLSIALADGQSSFSGNADMEISGKDVISETPVTGTAPVSIASLLLPPSGTGSFTFDVDTSAGTFKNVAVSIDRKDTGNGGSIEENIGFMAGYAHEIMLTIHDSQLGITVSIAEWQSTEGGGMDLVE